MPKAASRSDPRTQTHEANLSWGLNRIKNKDIIYIFKKKSQLVRNVLFDCAIYLFIFISVAISMCYNLNRSHLLLFKCCNGQKFAWGWKKKSHKAFFFQFQPSFVHQHSAFVDTEMLYRQVFIWVLPPDFLQCFPICSPSTNKLMASQG